MSQTLVYSIVYTIQSYTGVAVLAMIGEYLAKT